MAGERLSALDASFLHLEDDAAHMHVAACMLFAGEPPPYDELVEAIERRLHLVPRYRQRLATVPLGQGRPKWVDDPHLNLRYHVRQTSLPSPGSEAQLRALAGRVFSQRLDRDKPLWEIWLVEGLGGDRFALLSKTHHALVDGISGVDIVSVLFDTSPEPAAPPDPGQRWRVLPPRAPSCSQRRWSSVPPRRRTSSARPAPSCAPPGGLRGACATLLPESAPWPGRG
jgi:diacylglycerol O-acyltransferase